MPGAQQIRVDGFTTAQQVARGFFLLRRNVNGGQRSGPIEDRELARITSIRLDAIPRPSGNQGRRDHLTGNLATPQRALQLEATRAGFIAAPHRALALDPFDKAHNRAGSDLSECSAGVRCPGNSTAATVVAAC